MKKTITYPKSYAQLYSETISKPMINTMTIQSKLFTPKQPTFLHATSQINRIKPLSQPSLTVSGLSATLRKDLNTIKPIGNIQNELTSSLTNRLSKINSSYSKQLSSISNISTKWVTQVNRLITPVSHALKYYEENKEEIDKTLELFEKYAKDYPDEAEEMSVVEFIDFVEFQENFALVFKEVFSPVASYQVPSSYQMISDVYEKLDNQIEKYMTVEEKETIYNMFSIVVSFIFGKAVDDIPNFSEISTLVQLIIVVMFYPQIKKFLSH